MDFIIANNSENFTILDTIADKLTYASRNLHKSQERGLKFATRLIMKFNSKMLIISNNLLKDAQRRITHFCLHLKYIGTYATQAHHALKLNITLGI